MEGQVGKLHKRKDYLAIDEAAKSHPNRTYYYKKNVDAQKLIDSCSDVIEKDPENVKALFTRGTSLMKVEVRPIGRRWGHVFINIDARNGKKRHKISIACFNRNHDTSKLSTGRALNFYVHIFVTRLGSRGMVFYKLKLVDEAIHDFSQVLEMDSSHVNAGYAR